MLDVYKEALDLRKMQASIGSGADTLQSSEKEASTIFDLD